MHGRHTLHASFKRDGAECLAAGAHRDLPPERELVALTLKLAVAAIR